jgi:hypothetical protein
VQALCPATWAEVAPAHVAFCAENDKDGFGLFTATRSTSACRGYLRYTLHLFDGGPRYCLYDPATGKLRGYRAFDGKAMYMATTCGSSPGDYVEEGCAAVNCNNVALGAPACTWAPELDNDDGTVACRAARTLLSCPSAGGTVTCISNDPARCPMGATPSGATCTNQCAAGEYAVACGRPGPTPAPAPPAGCKDMRPTPGGVIYYCCPCGAG